MCQKQYEHTTLTDGDCRRFLAAMREFGYTTLTLEKVREVADKIGKGEDVSHDVIGQMMLNAIRENLERQGIES